MWGATMSGSQEAEPSWPTDTPILARLVGRIGSNWPNFRITEHTDPHGRSYTMIEWGDLDGDQFDPTAPNDFVSFVEDRPEPDEGNRLEG